MTEPHSPAQIAAEAPIPNQYPPDQQPPATPGWSTLSPAAPAKRSRAGLYAILTLVGVLVLCGGIAGTATYVSTSQYGIGAVTPYDAADAYLTGVYLHQEASEASAYLCGRADPNALAKHKVNEARAETEKYNSVFSWSQLHLAGETATSATVTTQVTAAAPGRAVTAQLTLTMIHANGWWVCDVKSSGN